MRLADPENDTKLHVRCARRPVDALMYGFSIYEAVVSIWKTAAAPDVHTVPSSSAGKSSLDKTTRRIILFVLSRVQEVQVPACGD